MKNISGIQIIGTQRSGSNLLRVMLGQSPEITAPHPPHILQNFVPLINYYKPFDETNYRELVDDVLSFIKFNPVPWDNIILDAETIVKRSPRYSIYDLFSTIYAEAARNRNTKYWCCKSMVNYKYYRHLENAGIRPKYIYLYRDGRDVAVSFKKAIVGEKHIYHLAKQWHADQLGSFALVQELGPERCLSLKYESLIADPEDTIRSVCHFLDIEFTGEMLQYYSSHESLITATSGEMWSNLTKPVMSNNHSKFLKELSEMEVALFELVAGESLDRLGYERYSHSLRNELLSDEMIARYDHENTMDKKKIAQANNADFNTRNGQRLVLENVKKRLVDNKIVL
jgi:hypothetical protein